MNVSKYKQTQMTINKQDIDTSHLSIKKIHIQLPIHMHKHKLCTHARTDACIHVYIHIYICILIGTHVCM